MKKQGKFIWCFGFLGFLGFTYFKTHEPMQLFWFSFFAYFSHCFINKLCREMPDERYFENSRKAKIKTYIIPLLTLFFVGFGTGLPFVTKEIIILTCAFGYSATLIAYAALFWYYDTH